MSTLSRIQDVDDLPDEPANSYSRAQKAAFKNAWNRAVDKGKDEATVREEARIAAKQKGDKGGADRARP